MAEKNKLTDKQIRFCEEYLIDLNATQAAIRSGYSEKTARSIGQENLTKPDIQEYITARQNALRNGLHVSQQRILQEYARIGFCDVRKLYDQNGAMWPIVDLDDDTAAALAGVEVYEGYSVSTAGIFFGCLPYVGNPECFFF